MSFCKSGVTHDSKMEAYCNAVHRLKDKFDVLELNHVPRKYNEDADELAKIASERTTIPLNVFARDLAKPSIDLENRAESGTSLSEPSNGNPSAGGTDAMDTEIETTSEDEAEAMQVDEAPL